MSEVQAEARVHIWTSWSRTPDVQASAWNQQSGLDGSGEGREHRRDGEGCRRTAFLPIHILTGHPSALMLRVLIGNMSILTSFLTLFFMRPFLNTFRPSTIFTLLCHFHLSLSCSIFSDTFLCRYRDTQSNHPFQVRLPCKFLHFLFHIPVRDFELTLSFDPIFYFSEGEASRCSLHASA